MEGCACPHATVQHGTADLFGTSICLVPGCDCDGTNRELIAESRLRAERRNAEMNRLVATIREVLSNKLPRSIDDQARNVAAALIATYKMEPL